MVYPNHSCMTAAQHARFLIIDGDYVIDEWVPAKFWLNVCFIPFQCLDYQEITLDTSFLFSKSCIDGTD